MPNTALYSTLKILGSPLLQGLYHHDVVGLENLPEGPYIVASNHLAFCDSIFIPLAMPRTVNFLAKSDYFTTPGVKGRAMAAFFRGVGQLPMDRSGGQKSQESLNAGRTDRYRPDSALRLEPYPSAPRRQAHPGAHHYRQAHHLRGIHRRLRPEPPRSA